MKKRTNKFLKISRNNSEYQVISALKENRTKRSKCREVFIEGIESIKQAVSAQIPVTRIIYQNYNTLSDWSKKLINKCPDAKKIELSSDLYNELCDKQNPSEIVMIANFTIEKLSNQKLPDKPFILILDRPGDKGNLGSIIRTANAMGIDMVIIIGHAVDTLDPKVIRASLGAVFFTKIVHAGSHNNFELWLKKVKEKTGLLLIGTDSDGEIELNNFSTYSDVAVLLGNESRGMSQKLKSLCDFIIRIPVTGNVNSLNVACAGSILLWYFKNF